MRLCSAAGVWTLTEHRRSVWSRPVLDTGGCEPPPHAWLSQQVAAEDCDRLSEDVDPVPPRAHFDDAAAFRDLVPDHLGSPETLGPERGEVAMRRAGHQVFIDSEPGREEARDEIAPT